MDGIIRAETTLVHALFTKPPYSRTNSTSFRLPQPAAFRPSHTSVTSCRPGGRDTDPMGTVVNARQSPVAGKVIEVAAFPSTRILKVVLEFGEAKVVRHLYVPPFSRLIFQVALSPECQ